jgi:hypothetical protein
MVRIPRLSISMRDFDRVKCIQGVPLAALNLRHPCRFPLIAGLTRAWLVSIFYLLMYRSKFRICISISSRHIS